MKEYKSKTNTEFYVGKSCKYGHDGLRYTKTRCCVQCLREYNKNNYVVKRKYIKNTEIEKQKRKQYLKNEYVIKYRHEWYLKRKNNLRKYFVDITRGRAKNRNLEHSITEMDIIIPEVCPVFGIPLKSYIGTKVNHPPDDAMSIDRIDSTKGYVPGNVQILSMKANRLKNNMSFSDIQKLYAWAKINLKDL